MAIRTLARIAATASSVAAIALLAGCVPRQPTFSAPKQTEKAGPAMRDGGAGDALLGSIGTKRNDGKGSYFEGRYVPNIPFEAHISSELTVDDSLDAGIRGLGFDVADFGSAKAKAGAISTSKYKIVTLRVQSPFSMAWDLNEVIKKDPKLKAALDGEGLRVVTSVSRIYDSSLANTIEASISGKTAITKSDKLGNLDFDIGGKSAFTLKIGDGTTVLYRLSRLCWDTQGELKDLKLDGAGPDKCPNGWVEKRP